MDEVRFLTAGDAALVVEFGKTIHEKVNHKVGVLAESLISEPVAGVVDMVPSFRSILVCFDPEQVARERLAGLLFERCKKLSEKTGEERTVIEIPVCYGARFGTDFQSVAACAGISGDELTGLHSGRDYRVYMFGFLPGFPHLGGLAEKLILPKPERGNGKIPAGAVCIRGEQAGIFPMEAHGGWWVIGATPVSVYDSRRERPILYEAGEYLRFVPVSSFEYYDIRRMVELGEYKCRVTKNGVEADGRDAGLAQGNRTVVDMGLSLTSVLRGGTEKIPETAMSIPSAGKEGIGKSGQNTNAAAHGTFPEKGNHPWENNHKNENSSTRGKSPRRQKKAAVKPDVLKRGQFEILTPGMLTTVQDYGRVGYQKYGFSVSGVMDRASYAYANALVGNAYGAAVLECTMLGPSFVVREDMVIAVTGADVGPLKNEQPMPMNEAVCLRRGDVVALGTAKCGCRAYLAVSGGIDVPLFLGSRSTHITSGIGGYQGRKLMAGDMLFAGAVKMMQNEKMREMVPQVKANDLEPQEVKFFDDLREASLAAVAAGAQDVVTLRVIQGPQKEYFTVTGEQVFFSEVYRLTGNCDRTGYQLDGTRVMSVSGVEIVPDGIAFGAVQISPAGKPIIMLSDRPVAGGYAKFGTVAEADIPKLAQLRPGAAVRFLRAEV